MTRTELLEVVYRFYPRGVPWTQDRYRNTEEHRRQREVARRAVAGYPTWDAMLDRLNARYSCRNFSVRIQAPDYAEKSYDPGYSGYIEIPGFLLGFHVSLLGPYYGIDRTGDPSEEPAALDLAREIEAAYPGYERIPPELGDEVVPNVGIEARHFGQATIYECLLSYVWVDDWGPYPRPKVPPPAYERPPGLRPKPWWMVVRRK